MLTVSVLDVLSSSVLDVLAVSVLAVQETMPRIRPRLAVRSVRDSGHATRRLGALDGERRSASRGVAWLVHLLWRRPLILARLLLAKSLTKVLHQSLPVAIGCSQIALLFWMLTNLEHGSVTAWTGSFPFALSTFLMSLGLQLLIALPIHALLPKRLQDSALRGEEPREAGSHRLDLSLIHI